MDINLINNMLLQGKTVKEIRQELGVSEKRFQKEIKTLGYKFNQKTKMYIKAVEQPTDILKEFDIDNIDTTTKATTQTTTPTTTNITKEMPTATLTTTQATTVDYLTENIGLIKQLLENYKRNTKSNNKDIIINLVSDKHLDPKPKSIRINEFVWRDWQEFTKDLTFSKSDLISQALKEFMKNHQIK